MASEGQDSISMTPPSSPTSSQEEALLQELVHQEQLYQQQQQKQPEFDSDTQENGNRCAFNPSQ